MEHTEQDEKDGVISRSVEASAFVMGVSPPTVRRLMDAGEIPYAQVRRRIVILDSDLRAYLARNRKTNGGCEAA